MCLAHSTRHDSARAQLKSLRGKPGLSLSLPDLPGPGRLLSCCARMHTRTHMCVVEVAWGCEAAVTVWTTGRTPGGGEGHGRAPSGRHTGPLPSPAEDSSRLDLWSPEAGHTREEPSLTGLAPAPLLTQSHELTSDSPAGLSEAGNWSSAHLLSPTAAGGGGEDSPISASRLLRSRQ